MSEQTPDLTKQQPSIGRSVHYRARGVRLGEVCRAATITEVVEEGSERVSLAVLGLSEVTFPRGVDRGVKPGTWHWPERVPPVTVEPVEPA